MYIFKYLIGFPSNADVFFQNIRQWYIYDTVGPHNILIVREKALNNVNPINTTSIEQSCFDIERKMKEYNKIYNKKSRYNIIINYIKSN